MDYAYKQGRDKEKIYASISGDLLAQEELGTQGIFIIAGRPIRPDNPPEIKDFYQIQQLSSKLKEKKNKK